MYRLSTAVKRLLDGVTAVGFVLDFMGHSAVEVLAGLLSKEFCEPTTTPPGVSCAINLPPQAPKMLINRIASWVVLLVSAVVDKSRGCGLVWFDSQHRFVNLQYAIPELHCLPAASRNFDRDRLCDPSVTSSLRIDLQLHKGEFKKLIELTGLQGVKTILTEVHSLAAMQLKTILNFLVKYRPNLIALEERYLISQSAIAGFTELDALLDALVSMGVVMRVRQMLQEAIEETSCKVLASLRQSIGRRYLCSFFFKRFISMINRICCSCVKVPLDKHCNYYVLNSFLLHFYC